MSQNRIEVDGEAKAAPLFISDGQNLDLQTQEGNRCFEQPESEDDSAFAKAARFIQYRPGPDASGATHSQRRKYEQQQIIGWLKQTGAKRLEDAHLEGFPVLSNSTSEHEVRLSESDGRVLKRTWPGYYGEVPVISSGKLERRPALPSEYLLRQDLQNEVFASDLRLEGINISEKPSLVIGEASGQPSFVVSQAFIEAADAGNPTPSMRMIEEFLTELGFEYQQGSYYGWIRRADGIAIVDARPDNFILSVEGVVPIDLQIARIQISEELKA